MQGRIVLARVSLKNIDKHYGAEQVLFDVSLEVEDGEFVVFVGPSGCGKSTLLRIIAGLEDVTAGEVLIADNDVTMVAPSDRGVAMVFQSYALYPHMTVRGNLEFGMKINGVAADERTRRIDEAARVLQIEEYLERKPSQLSGGQRQRVAIGRAIVKQPNVFLFDEPLSNLDAKLRIQMRVELEGLHRHLGSTMIYVTHDQVEAMTLAEKMIVLKDGRIEQVGPPLEIYNRPETEFVAGFIGAPSMNFFDVDIAAGSGLYGKTKIELPETAATGRVRLGIRPEHIQIVEVGAGTTDVEIELRELLGGESYLYARTEAGDSMVIKAGGETPVQVGETVGLVLPAHRLHFFGEDGRRIDAGSGGAV
jgi:ABC-type sugar transport system ATPase subunit